LDICLNSEFILTDNVATGGYVALMALAQRPDVFKVKTVQLPFFVTLFLASMCS